MLSTLRTWTPIGLLILGVKDSYAVPHYQNTSVSSSTTSSCSTTKHAHPTTTTSTTCTTTTTSVPSTITSYTTVITHHTNSTTTTKTYVPTTITSFTTSPIPTYTTSDLCPTTCSVSAGTVEVFFWPTGNDFSYPATYVDTALDYTFTSPSVYMLINTIVGTNPVGATVGPSATSIIFAFDLDEVSTIVPGSEATRQLSLSDLGTDCPLTAEPSAILTMSGGGRCDPILAAPDKVKSWASPCGACGQFGLFDPPYAVPTIDGGLVGTTTTTTEAVTTATGASTAATSATAKATTTAVVQTTTAAAAPTTPTTTVVSTVDSTTTTGSSATSAPTAIQTAAATKVTGATACLILGLSLAVFLS